MKFINIEKFCSKMERNDPSFLKIDFALFPQYRIANIRHRYVDVDGSIGINSNTNNLNIFVSDHSRGHGHGYGYGRFIKFKEETLCRMFGRAIGNNTTLASFFFWGGIKDETEFGTEDGVVIDDLTARCMEVLYDELKQSKTIRCLGLCLMPGVPTFDLEYFSLNNKNFNSLTLRSPRNMQPAQNELIGQLETLQRCKVNFLNLIPLNNDRLLERVIPMCLEVKINRCRIRCPSCVGSKSDSNTV